MSIKDADECPVCFEEYNRLKILQCGHAFCSKCIERTSRAENEIITVSCPYDQTKTTLPDGKATNLKTKFFAYLACESCFTDKSINESWWCETCEATTCSDCAMKKHRNHSCKEWNEFGVVKECYALYKSKTTTDDNQNSNIDVRNSIHEFCMQLEEAMLNFINEQEQSKRAMVDMKNAFGDIETVVYPNGYTVEKLEKKLNTVSKLIQTVPGSVVLPQISCTVQPIPVFKPPSKDQILALCFELKSTLTIPAEQPAATAISGISFCRNVHYDFDNPANSLCALPNDKIAVFDNRGIHIMDVINDKCVKFRPWEIYSFDFYCQSIFRPIDDSLFLCSGYSKSNNRQQLLKTNGELFQYNAESLSVKNMFLLPESPMIGSGYKRLLTISKSGNVFIAASDGSVSALWVFEKITDKFSKLWEGKLEIFWDIQIVDTMILIAGQTKVYSFQITPGTVTIGIICSGCGPLFQMRKNVFQIDTSKKLLRRIFVDQMITDGEILNDLNIRDSESSLTILISINDETLCSLSLKSKTLRLFRLT